MFWRWWKPCTNTRPSENCCFGRGITGLSCAKRLASHEVIVFEKTPRVGGIVETLRQGGALMECGPDSIFIEEDWVGSYLKDLGLESEIILTNPDKCESFVLSGKNFIPMGEAIKSLPPSEILPFLWNSKSAGDFKSVHYDKFVSFKDGMGRLAQKMAESLPAGSVQLGCEVEMAVREGGGFLIFSSRGEDRVDGLCLALPARACSAFLRTINSCLSQALAQIPVRACATVNFLYPAGALPEEPRGFGFVAPASEKRSITGATFSSVKFAGRAPAGQSLVRVFLSEKSFPKLAHASEEEILKAARREIEDILGIRCAPAGHAVKVFTDSMPDYLEGHAAKSAAVEAKAKDIEGLVLAGNWLNGAGISRCIQAGEAAAGKLLDYLGRKIPKQEV